MELDAAGLRPRNEGASKLMQRLLQERYSAIFHESMDFSTIFLTRGWPQILLHSHNRGIGNCVIPQWNQGLTVRAFFDA